MSFHSGRLYRVTPLARDHPLWEAVQAAVARRARPESGRPTLVELYDLRWQRKPFPWSWSQAFKPQRRFFFHGTSTGTVRRILDQGFRVAHSRHGRLLGDGVYATYHTDKGLAYGEENYLFSVMVYAPHTYVVHPGQAVERAQLQQTARRYEAIEVRSGALVGGHRIRDHEICVFDPRRVVPRFLLRVV